MEQLNETAQVDRELEEARDDLRETLQQVKHKVEEIEARLRPEAIVRRNPLALPVLAGILGFFAGTDGQSRPLRWIIAGALLGAAVAVAYQGKEDGSIRNSQ
jgi:hypothetical protein